MKPTPSVDEANRDPSGPADGHRTGCDGHLATAVIPPGSPPVFGAACAASAAAT